jgi:small subunit ribosomal protein S4
MKRKHKTYSKPKRPFDKTRLDEEAQIKKEFGLKNKKEIWKADANINSLREKAKKLISADEKEQQALFDRLKKIGINVETIADILSLTKQDYLKRRLQTVLVTKKLATTTKSARQLITHKKVLINGRVVNRPSYIVPIELENKISLKPSKPRTKKEEPKQEEVTEEAKPVEEKSEKVNKEEAKE